MMTVVETLKRWIQVGTWVSEPHDSMFGFFFFIESKLSRLLLCYELTLAANTGRESTILKHLNSNAKHPNRVYSCHWFIPVFSKHVLGVTHLVILRSNIFSFFLRDFPNVCYVESFQKKYKRAFFLFKKYSFIVTGWGLLVVCSDQPVVLFAVFQLMSLTRKLQSSL